MNGVLAETHLPVSRHLRRCDFQNTHYKFHRKGIGVPGRSLGKQCDIVGLLYTAYDEVYSPLRQSQQIIDYTNKRTNRQYENKQIVLKTHNH